MMICLLFFGCLAQWITSAQKMPEKSPPLAPNFRLTDITASARIQFEHAVSLEEKVFVESMSGGVLLLDYDQDGWLDIYFTNAPSVDQALHGQKVEAPSITIIMTGRLPM